MPNCMEQVYSEEYYDFLIPYGVEAEVPSTPGCVQRIAEDYDIFFYPREGLPPLSIGNYTYTAIPKCYALLDTTGRHRYRRRLHKPAVPVFGRQQQNPADLGSDGTGRNAAGGNSVRCRVP